MTPRVHAPPRPPSERRTNGRIPPAPPDFGGDGDDDREHGLRRGLDNLRLAVLFFMGAEAMFFGALISALLVLRLGMAAWPPPLEPRLPIAVTGLNTLVLLASSVTLVTAGRASRPRGRPPRPRPSAERRRLRRLHRLGLWRPGLHVAIHRSHPDAVHRGGGHRRYPGVAARLAAAPSGRTRLGGSSAPRRARRSFTQHSHGDDMSTATAAHGAAVE